MSELDNPSPLARERSSSAFNRRSEFTNDFGVYIKTAETQTIGGPLVLINQKQKKKPYDVKFSNFQPKIQPQIKYTAKQAFRQYKSKIEPKLKEKIEIDEEDDLVKKIKEAFGIKRQNTNYNEIETAPAAGIFTDFQDPRTFQEKNEIIDQEGNIIKGRQRQMEPLPEDEINGYLYSKIDPIRYQQLEEKLKEIEGATTLTEEQKEAAKSKLEIAYIDDHRKEIAKYKNKIRPTLAQKHEAEYERARIFEAVDETKFAIKVDNYVKNGFKEEDAQYYATLEIYNEKKANNSPYLKNISLNEADKIYEKFSAENKNRVDSRKYLMYADRIKFIMEIAEEERNKKQEITNILLGEREALTGRKQTPAEEIEKEEEEEEEEEEEGEGEEEEEEEEEEGEISPVAETEISEASTRAIAGEAGEMTTADLRRKPGRPPTKPKTIARRAREEAARNAAIAKKLTEAVAKK